MSWAEDNLIDIYDEPDFSYLENTWMVGEHQDREGNQYELSEMKTSHLINTVRYFEDIVDTKYLKKELKKRGINI